MFCGYKYSKPKVFLTKEIVEKNIPIKINTYRGDKSFGDSIILFLPYKFKVHNNRLRKIAVANMYFKKMSDFFGQDFPLYYDDDGNQIGEYDRTDRQIVLDNLLNEKKFLQYYKLYNAKIVFPFSSKIVYYYKPYKLSKSVLEKELLLRQEYVKLYEDFIHNQRKSLLSKSTLSIPKKIIDSLYESDSNQNLIFTFEKKTKSNYGNYKIKFKLSNSEQNLTDNYKIIEDIVKRKDKDALMKFFNKPVYEN